MNVYSTRNQLWGELTSLRIDIRLLKMGGGDPKAVRERELKALDVALQLKAECSGALQ